MIYMLNKLSKKIEVAKEIKLLGLSRILCASLSNVYLKKNVFWKKLVDKFISRYKIPRNYINNECLAPL